MMTISTVLPSVRTGVCWPRAGTIRNLLSIMCLQVFVYTYQGLPKHVLQGSLKAIVSVAFSKTGEMVMASSNDNSIKIWNTDTRRLTVFSD